MKKIILSSIFLLTNIIFSQNNLGFKTTVFSFTPKNENIEQVDGLTIGLGLDAFNEGSIQKINGLNLEVNPLSLLYLMFANPKHFTNEYHTTVNGLHVSTGSISNLKTNGLAVSFLNIGHAANGVSINGMYTHITKLNGFHVSGLGNYSKIANGLFISASNDSELCYGSQLGLFNSSETFKGLQIGVVNRSEDTIGVQIGLFNLSKKYKGLQIGFWNINNKRSMPFINW